MNVETILRYKGRSVATIAPDMRVSNAVTILHRKKIGALVVSSDGAKVEGILSERDIVHALAEHGTGLLELPVSQVMVSRVFTCAPADSVADLMAEMTERRIRHLPVVDKGVLAGIVSIGDVVKSRVDEVEFEANEMRQMIVGA
jgi:CBS domain-containing protein